MKPIRFPQQNGIWGEMQPPYQPLPAYTGTQQTVSLWALTWWERFVILCTGRLWLRQLNFGRPLQPQLPSVRSPFVTDAAPRPASPLITAPPPAKIVVVDQDAMLAEQKKADG